MQSPEQTSTASESDDADLVEARRVIALEVCGLQALSQSLGTTFVTAVELIEKTEGRVIVTGMGKSGHVAAKICATLASTGTPAHFVHPAEASHGDLGMIVAGDTVLALSNSGETPELGDLVAHTKRFAIPLIGMTGRADSSLASRSDAPLILPSVTEACVLGLAPTTSTTVMLALGDALAMALLRRRGFSTDDFKQLHPGGKLGMRLMKVADLMHRGDELPLTEPAVKMSKALMVMTAKSFGCVGVVDNAGGLLGVVTDGDLRRHMADDLLTLRADAVMTRQPATIDPDALASEAVNIMNSRKITNLFVVKDGRPVGILHIHDCLRAGVA